MYGSIPGTAVLASIPLLAILRHLPSYFLQPGYHTLSAENPLIGIGWDYKEKKSSYRRFCRDMSGRFFSLNTEERLAETTAGSLALALAFLRPWFHQMIDKESDQAVQTLVALALVIAQWPGQSWMRERPEIHDLIYAMTLTLSQELREKHGLQVKDELSRLRGVVNELHEVVREYEVKFNSLGKRPKANQSRRPTPTLFINPTAPVFSPPMDAPSPFPTRTAQISASKAQTPLTPPDTPKSSSFSVPIPPISESAGPSAIFQDNRTDDSPKPGSESRLIPIPGTPTPLSAAALVSINAIASQSIPPKHHNIGDTSTSPSNTHRAQPRASSIALTPPLAHPRYSHTPSSALSDLRPEEIPLPPTPPQCSPTSENGSEYSRLAPPPSDDEDSWTIILSHTSDFESEDDGDDDTQVDEDVSYRKGLQDSIATLRDSAGSPAGSPTLVITALPEALVPKEVPEYIPPRPRSGMFAEPLEFDYAQVEVDEEHMFRRPPRMLETAGCLVTGFLVGAFVTIALLSPQRRMIIHLT